MNYKLLIWGIVSFVITLSLSIYFYLERTVFLDISFHLFYLLKDKSFAIQNYRYAAFFTQLFPLSAGELGWSLKSIAVLYSASFVLLPLIVFGLIVGCYKNLKIGVAYLFYLSVMATHSFFWIQSELPQGMAFLFLFLAVLDDFYHTNKAKSLKGLLLTLLLFLIVFSHPLVIFPMSFIGLYFWLYYIKNRWTTVVVFALFIFIYGIKSVFFKTGYDSSATDSLLNYSFSWKEVLSLPSLKLFLHYLVTDYYLWGVFFITIVLYYWLQKEFVKLLLVIMFSFALISIICITYINSIDQFYLENQYQLLAFFVVIPVSYDLTGKLNFRWIVLCLVVMQGLFVMRVCLVSKVYEKRLEYYRNIMSSTESWEKKKIIYPIALVDKEIILMDWASSYEFWLLSTIETGNTRSIIISYQKDEFDYAISNNHCFITKWGAPDYNEFKSPYFVLDDTTGYIKLQE